MVESIVDFFVNLLDYTSEWWLGKAADRLARKHPEKFGEEQ